MYTDLQTTYIPNRLLFSNSDTQNMSSTHITAVRENHKGISFIQLAESVLVNVYSSKSAKVYTLSSVYLVGTRSNPAFEVSIRSVRSPTQPRMC